MPRYLFPADRTAYVYTGPGRPITIPDHVGLSIYLDEGATTLADIRTPDDDPIPGSLVYTDPAGLLPEFLGPDSGQKRLWAKPAGGAAYPVDANYGDQIDFIGEGVGVPSGGDTGTALVKSSMADFDTKWATFQEAQQAAGIYVQDADPTGSWGPADAGKVWIKPTGEIP